MLRLDEQPIGKGMWRGTGSGLGGTKRILEKDIKGWRNRRQ